MFEIWPVDTKVEKPCYWQTYWKGSFKTKWFLKNCDFAYFSLIHKINKEF